MKLKQSVFNDFIQDISGGSKLVFNSETTTLAKWHADVCEYLDQFPVIDLTQAPKILQEKLLAMHASRFLVEHDRDEFRVIAIKARARRFNVSNGISLTIAPTLQCNMACVYCFEKGAQKGGIMPFSVQDDLINFADIKCSMLAPSRTLNVTWYGGEPLLAMEVIRSLTPRLKT